jgi:uncharacterized membrane protein
MKKILFLAIISIFQWAFGQQQIDPQIQWQNTIGGISQDLLNDIHKYKFDSKNIPSFEIDKTKLSFSFHINSLF